MPRQSGFTLVEIAIVLVIVGLLLGAVLQGQELIRNARVRNLIAEKDAVSAAMLAFQDRFQALPGDYLQATLNIRDAVGDGNGNGRIEDAGTIPEYVLVWTHLSSAGFLNAGFSASAVTTPDPENTPSNVFGGFMQVIYDRNWGFSGNDTQRHNLKTGNHIPVDLLAEIDRKTDDGLPTLGQFQFSPYALDDDDTPDWGGSDTACTTEDDRGRNTLWNVASRQPNCGAASLL